MLKFVNKMKKKNLSQKWNRFLNLLLDMFIYISLIESEDIPFKYHSPNIQLPSIVYKPKG